MTAAQKAVLAALAVLIPVASYLVTLGNNVTPLAIGTVATGVATFGAHPTDNKTIGIGGQTFPARAHYANDAAAPFIACMDGGCSTAAATAQAVAAAINGQPTNKVRAGTPDGGVGYYVAKDAGLAGNVPIAGDLPTATVGMSGGYDPATTGGPLLGKIRNTFVPTTSGLIAPLGSIARTDDGTKAWSKTGTGNTDWSSPQTYSTVESSRLKVLAGSRIVYDADFNTAALDVAGLSSAKRYRFQLSALAPSVGGTTYAYLNPNGSSAGTVDTVVFRGGGSDPGAGIIGSQTNIQVQNIRGTVEPRRGGVSSFEATSSVGTAGIYTAFGQTTTDFTSLTFAFGSSCTGHLFMTEENP